MSGNNSTNAVKSIGKPDGATAYFIIGGKNHKPTLKQHFYKWRFNVRKAWVAKRIKANPHTLDAVCEYIKTKRGFEEIPVESEEYQKEYRELRAAFLMQHEPELLGEQRERLELKGHSEEEIKQFMEAVEARKQLAYQVPKENFDIEFHLLKKKMEKSEMHVLIEKSYGYIGGGASGSKKEIRQFDKIYKAIWRYYGVTREDIDSKSERYQNLIKSLAR